MASLQSRSRYWKRNFRFWLALVIVSFFSFQLFVSVAKSDLFSFLWSRFEPLHWTLSGTKKQNYFFVRRPESIGGKCFLFFHGVGATPQLAWRDFFHEASQGNLEFWNNKILIAPELEKIPGFKEYRFDQVLSRVFSQIESLEFSECKNWIVVGNSLGGWLAFLFAEKFPSLTESVIAINSVGLDRDYSFIKNVMANPTSEGLRSLHLATYFRAPEIPFWVWSGVAEQLKKNPMIVSNEKSPFFLDSRLGAIKTPSLLIWGLADRVIPNLTDDFKKINPGIKIEKLTNCGHTPQVECFSRVSSIIEEFVN